MILSGLIAGAAVAIVGLWKAPETVSKIALALIQSDGVTQTVVSLGIVGSILALTIMDKIPAAAGIGVLSAIAGYVFGDMRRRKSKTPQSN